MKRRLRPQCPLLKGQGGNNPVISPLSSVPEITYDAVMYSHLCPVAPPFQRSGGNVIVVHPRSDVPG